MVTEKELKSIIEYLNETTGNSKVEWVLQKDNTYRSNIGNYHLDCAYGGYNLAQFVNECGGINHPLGMGFYSKKELAAKIRSFISGIELGKIIKTKKKSK